MDWKKVDITDKNSVEHFLQTHAHDSDFFSACFNLCFIAVMYNAHENLKLLIKAGGQAVLSDEMIVRAASNGHAQCLEALLPHYDLETSLGETILSFSAKKGCLECLQVCDGTIQNATYWYTALAQACMYGRAHCVPFLLCKADATVYNSRVLNLALQYKEKSIAELLAKHVNIEDAYNDAHKLFSDNLPQLEVFMLPIRLKRRLSAEIGNSGANACAKKM